METTIVHTALTVGLDAHLVLLTQAYNATYRAHPNLHRVLATLRQVGFVCPRPGPLLWLSTGRASLPFPLDLANADLPVALACLLAGGFIAPERLQSLVAPPCAVSNLGRILPTRATYSIAELAQVRQFETLVIARDNAPEVQGRFPHLRVLPVTDIQELVVSLATLSSRPAVHGLDASEETSQVEGPEVSPPAALDRAFQIAVAGGHSLLLAVDATADPHALGRQLLTYLPPLIPGERVEIDKIYSAAQLAPPFQRPLRTLRPSAAPQRMVLGRRHGFRPGELTLAHHGLLLVLEPQNIRGTLREIFVAHRQGTVTMSSHHSRVTYPAHPLLLGISTLDLQTAQQLTTFRRTRIGPGSFDLAMDLPSSGSPAPQTIPRRRIAEAAARLALEQPLPLGDGIRLPDSMGIGADAARTLSVARTIAALDGAALVRSVHLSEAIALSPMRTSASHQLLGGHVAEPEIAATSQEH